LKNHPRSLPAWHAACAANASQPPRHNDGLLQDDRHQPEVSGGGPRSPAAAQNIGARAEPPNHLLDHEIDLSGFDERFSNDDTGASAYPPAMLLKVVLLAYSRGIVSSRAIERACREHVTFIALSGDTCPHFTTIAAFVSGLGDLIGKVFQQVLLICDAQGLIGREMFAPAIRLRRRNLQCGRSTRLAPWQA